MFLAATIFSFLLGAVFGSFASMASYRLAEDKSLFTKHSYCPVCGHSLSAKDLIPLLSWVWLKGKCRYCHAPIAWHYPATELGLGLAFLLVYMRFGLAPDSFLLWGVAVCLAILIKVDFSHYFLPDSIQLALLGLALGYLWLHPGGMIAPIIGALGGVFLGVMLRFLGYYLKKQEAFGWGDIKFLGITGVFLGIDLNLIAIFLFLSGLLGIATGLVWRAFGKGALFPFGPALAGALFICLLYPGLGHIIPNVASFLGN